jgi:hypothetical protein
MDYQHRILTLTDRIIEDTLNRIAQDGTFRDVVDVDGKGGERTQRLSNVTGLSEIRLIRSTMRKELGLDAQPEKGVAIQGTDSRVSILTLLQNGKLELDQLKSLGTDHE